MNLFGRHRFSLSPGDEAAGFTIVAPAGCGSAGEVYLVRDASGKHFALKISAPQRELPGMTAYRSLPPNEFLTTLHAVGKLPDGRIYSLMEAADNRAKKEENYLPDTLSLRIAEAPLKAEEALTVFLRLLSALEILHGHHLMHGDIKPENVIFCSGKAKLSDFGTIGPAGSFAGATADFLPPEAFDSPASAAASPRNDLYAMGKLLYCLWTGRSPAEFPTPPIHPDSREFRIIRPLYTKACRQEPAYRFHTAQEMADAAKKALHRLHGSSLPRGKRRIPALSALAALLLLGGTLFLCRHAKRCETLPSTEIPAALRQSIRREIAVLDAMLPLSPQDEALRRKLLARKEELAAVDAGRLPLGKQQTEDPEIGELRRKLLTSPELYLTPEITAQTRRFRCGCPHAPPHEIEGEIGMLWDTIQDECRFPRLSFAERKKLAERLKKALLQAERIYPR